MQLKRDTDYALRLLLKLHEKAPSADSAISLRELCSETGVPCMAASRILEHLKGSTNVCTSENGNNKIVYFLNEDAEQLSLYDLISVIEGNAALFTAFNKSSPAYSLCIKKLLLTEADVIECLSNVTLADLSSEKISGPG